ncbi:amidohydrolase [Caulobacter segnis]|uniref:amidohydrolase n=1 Tax=Caulobacter segnis TaxID=88688 RepID=UPI0024108220|nr:amidohydrolase [Caulobacter segnis]MDG2522942.1 amidohydrolase [Caulobacter segnis]
MTRRLAKGAALIGLFLAASSGALAQAAKPAPTETALALKLRPGLDPRGADFYPSTYKPIASRPVAIVNANILTGTGAEIRGGTIVLSGGKIAAVGQGVTPPAGAQIVDAAGRWVTPGVIDAHSHLGAFSSPGVDGTRDGNENVDPVTPQVWVEHSVWPQDPGFDRARAGGVTSLMILPGSANLFGGRSVALKNVPATTVQAMKFPGAPYGLKMACGENPKERYGSRGRSPATRMGNLAVTRRTWIEAGDYARRWEAFGRRGTGDAPKRDVGLDTLSGVLNGDISVQNHCYRADEMGVVLDLAKEFGYRVTAFHHAVEAYKIADLLKANNVCAAVWANRLVGKMEGNDAIEENAGILQQAGVCVAIHSDSATVIQRLNIESSIALAAARRAGIQISDAEAVKWFTANPAKIMGVLDQTGTLEVGKMGDVVLWSHNPFDIYAVAKKVYIDGAQVYDDDDPAQQHRSDFELIQPKEVN